MQEVKFKPKWWLILLILGLFISILVLMLTIWPITNSNNTASGGEVMATPILSQTLTPSYTIAPTLTPTPSPIPSPEPNPEVEYSAWIPTWASPSGLSSVKGNPGLFKSISPVWYEVNVDGTLKTTFPANRKEIMDYAKANNIKIYATIAMFDHELFTKVLQSPEALEKQVQSIVSAAKLYDGIDMDYESTKLNDKEKYFELLSRLSEEFKKLDKKLIVTVIAKWGDTVIYPSLPETRQVQDWSEISKYADEVRIMAYDYTFTKSKYPGPIAPIDWVHDILDYALTKLPPEKIVLGIHLYSYEWAFTADKNSSLVMMGENENGDTSANSYTYTTVKSILKDHKGEVSEFQNESVFQYDSGGKKKTLIYQNPEQVKARIKQAQEFGIKGVVFWRLGGEGELLTNLDDPL